MAQTKTYKGKKSGYYTIPFTPARHEARLTELYRGPFDNTHGHDEQNAPTGADNRQFGRKDGKSEAD